MNIYQIIKFTLLMISYNFKYVDTFLYINKI